MSRELQVWHKMFLPWKNKAKLFKTWDKSSYPQQAWAHLQRGIGNCFIIAIGAPKPVLPESLLVSATKISFLTGYASHWTLWHAHQPHVLPLSYDLSPEETEKSGKALKAYCSLTRPWGTSAKPDNGHIKKPQLTQFLKFGHNWKLYLIQKQTNFH